jgi:L-iditol 2-dehydrogenase
MKALVNTAPYVLELQDWPVPEPGSTDLLIKVGACAICGSDVKGYSGKTGRRQPPIVMGHEAAGVVVQVGDDAVGFKPGDRVCFDSTVYCRKCEFCLSGHINLCENRRVLGVSCDDYRQHGAMAEYLTVPYWIAVHMPESLSFEQASLIETVSIGVHGANRTPIAIGDTVVVLGAGPVGLFALQAIKLKGATKVVITDLAQGRLDLAKSLGADVTLRADGPDLQAKLRAEVGPVGADAAIEAVGIEPTVATGLGIVRKGGALTLIGNVSPSISVDLQSIVTREITLYGSCASNGEYVACVGMVANGDIAVDPLISERVPLEQGQEVFDRLYKGAANHCKSVFVFDQD